MEKRILRYLGKGLLPGVFISALVLVAVMPVSCKGPVEGLVFLEGDFESPKISGVKVKSSNLVEINFTEAVGISNLSVVQDDLTEVNISCEMEGGYEKDGIWYGTNLKIKTTEEMKVGEPYEIDGLCTDQNGNSLTFSIPFIGYNSRVPEIVISEVRNAYGWSTAGGEKRRRGEYIELYALTDGNLSGVKILSANDGDKTSFVLPSCEVKKGEYITVHMRRFNDEDLISGEVIANELGENLELSSTKDSSASRDIWNTNYNACFATSDIIILQRVSDEKVLDCIEYALSETKDWPSEYAAVINLVRESGAWNGEPLCTDNLSATSLTRGISRQNIKQLVEEGKKEAPSAGDFLVVKKVTPGAENSDAPVTSK